MSETAVASPSSPDSQAVPEFYARKATGLVREVPLYDMALFNAAGSGGAALFLGFAIVGALAVLPRANLYIAFPAALLLPLGMYVLFALLTATMPKSGGDYVFNGRILHPIVGFAGNVCLLAATLFSIGLWAALFVPQAFVSVIASIGAVTGSKSLSNAATTLSSKGWAFAIGAIVVIGMSVLAATRTKLALRTMAVCFTIGVIGLLVSILMLAVASRSGVIGHLNSVNGTESYRSTIAAATKGGVQLPGAHGYSTSQTIAAVFLILPYTLFCWWGAYLGGEMKGGGRRKRQLIAMIAPVYVQGLVTMIAFALYFHVVGVDFAAAAATGHYSGVFPSTFPFVASIAFGGWLLPVVLGVCYFAWFLPGAFTGGMAMPPRVLLAWSLDGLVPHWVGKVNSRTHTPVNAIVITAIVGLGFTAWAAFSSNFTSVAVLTALLAFPMFVIAGIAGIVLPTRRRDIYTDSPADWKVGGVTVIRAAGVGSIVVGVYGLVGGVVWHTDAGLSNPVLAIALPFIIGAGAAVWYEAARAIRKRQEGVDIALMYRALPPD